MQNNHELKIQSSKYNKVLLSIVLLCSFTLGIPLHACSSTSPDNETTQSINIEKDPVLSKTFYTPPSIYKQTKDVVKDYGVDLDPITSDSEKFQYAIDDLSKRGGGILTVPAGSYRLINLYLKSNVHIRFNSKATVLADIPTHAKTTTFRAYWIFRLSALEDEASKGIENVSIEGVGGAFTINQNPDGILWKGRPFIVQNVRNFRIAHVKVQSNLYPFSNVVLNGHIDKQTQEVYQPRYGEVEDIEGFNNNAGYGVVQMQLGQHILYKNLEGHGGVTLRIETDTEGAQLAKDKIDEVYARDIRSVNGYVSVWICPHAIDHGLVDVRDVYAENSCWAVHIDYGLAHLREQYGTGGTFNPASTVRDIKARYTADKAQVPWAHMKFYPTAYQAEAKARYRAVEDGKNAFFGRAIGVVLNKSNYDFDIDPSYITETDGFEDKLLFHTPEELYTAKGLQDRLEHNKIIPSTKHAAKSKRNKKWDKKSSLQQNKRRKNKKKF